ncbi:hypothetical protein QE430_000119 [Microbacterium testaceum]|nr:hypothetical protein [Microbacterium testaceum]MDQ1171812.1 hypothetical protein [Microbacterium testaceum]
MQHVSVGGGGGAETAALSTPWPRATGKNTAASSGTRSKSGPSRPPYP